jgi:PERQ amino acid-rich with GYF domain-containing protein
MTAEQRMFFMQLATHQPRPPVDPYVMKQPQAPSNQLDIRRLMSGGDFYQQQQQQVPQQPPPQQAPPPQPPQQTQQPEPDPIHQLIMQLQMQQKTGGVDAAQWIKPSQQQTQQPEMPPQMVQQPPPVQQHQQPQQNSSSTHWSGTPMNIWDLGSGNKEQHHQHPMHEVQMAQQHQQQSDPDILQNGDDSQHQMQKVESKKKKKEVVKENQAPQAVKEQPKEKKQPQPVEKKKQEKKKEERTTQPAAPAPWVGHQNNVGGTSLTKIQKTEAQRRQIELAQQKEREQKQLEMMTKQEIRDVKWNLQMPPAASVKTLDEIQAEEQTAAEREERAKAKHEKKEVVIVGDIWNTGAHSMAWQQPKTWSAAQSNSGFWEDPVKQTAQPKQAPQMLSKSQTMATISTAKKQVQQQQQIQQQAQVAAQQKKQEVNNKKKPEKKKDDNNNEFTTWCTRTLSAMNGNVDSELINSFNLIKIINFLYFLVPTFVMFLQDLESPFEVKDYIKMYLGKIFQLN